MGKADKGTPRDVANRMKAKGLQKLKWYCQICERQCRDENGFRNHTQGESHQKKALYAGENSGKTIANYSRQFQADFVRQLRMAHNEKKVNANVFYNKFIQSKDHTHMNSTRWHTLTEFVKHLGRNGIVRVTEDEKDGVMIQWVDNSAEALERAEMAKKKERSQRGDEQQMQKLIQQQIDRANEGRQTVETEEKIDEKPDGPISIQAPVIEANQPKPKVQRKNVFASMGKKSPNLLLKHGFLVFKNDGPSFASNLEFEVQRFDRRIWST